jgi:dsDNA-specific endonuclease/ATPase MutS2
MTREAAERNRLQTQTTLDEAKRIREQVSEERERIHEEGKRLKNQADEEIEDTMRQVRHVMDDFSVQMQNAPAMWKDQANELAERISGLASSTPLAVRHARFIEALRAGDSVFVIPFKREAIVHRIRRKRRKVVLFMEGKQVEVAFEDISKPYGAG